MPNDAKLGLVIGVALVIAVAVLFFQKDPATAQLAPTSPRVAAANTGANPFSAVSSTGRPAEVAKASRTVETANEKQYTVQEGDTLASLAERYYGDKEKASAIAKANADLIKDGALTPGTVLMIPASSAGDNSGASAANTADGGSGTDTK